MYSICLVCFCSVLFRLLICRAVWPSIWSSSSLMRRRRTLSQAHHFTIMSSSISFLNHPKYPQHGPGKGKFSPRYDPDEALSLAIARCPPGHPTLTWEKPAHHNTKKSLTSPWWCQCNAREWQIDSFLFKDPYSHWDFASSFQGRHQHACNVNK